MTADTLARLALALDGTVEVAHFDRRAFKTRTIYATLARDGSTANLKLDRDQQDHWCDLLPTRWRPWRTDGARRAGRRSTSPGSAKRTSPSSSTSPGRTPGPAADHGARSSYVRPDDPLSP